MPGRLEGKRAVVTGGGNGIGRAISEAFLHEGADLFFTVRTDTAAAEGLMRHAREQGRRAGYLVLDAAENGAADRLFYGAMAALGGADVLVNNAATMTRSAFLDITEGDYQRVLDVNLRFPFFASQCFGRHMAERGGGSIINISSVSGRSAVSRMAHYQCSKAGLDMLTRGAAFELAASGVRVNTIAPGLTRTQANRAQWQDDPSVWDRRASAIPMGRTGVAADHAGAAVFLASDESAWMTGGYLVIDGGLSVG